MRTRRTERAACALWLVALALVLGAGCVPRPAAKTAAGADLAWMRTELYFGLSRADGTTVSDADWEAFLATEVTPRFPEGLTVLAAKGQWRTDAGAITREASRMVVIVHPGSAAERERLNAIRAAYTARFAQSSVLLVESPARVSF